EAEATLDGWYRAVGDAEPSGSAAVEVLTALCDDLGTPSAIAAMHELRAEAAKGNAGAKAGLKASAAMLGLLAGSEADWSAAKFASMQDDSAGTLDTAAIEERIGERLAFIREKNWAEADRIRDELLKQGIQLKDGKDPATGGRVTTWEVKR
ncbi:MAG TPA: DALR domain-containing protein, partial [Rhizobiaceae bacterium]|nr:DALR domain-containing protein [Rhizobiaceae bacterium]